MQEIRLGVVGLNFPNFEAAKHNIWEETCGKLMLVSKQLHLKLIYWPTMLGTIDEAKKAALFFRDQKIDFLLMQASSFFLGDLITPLLDLNKRTGLWFVKEPVYSGELQLNSLTGFNLAVSYIKKYKKNIQFKWFLGFPGEPEFDEPFSITMKALRVLTTIPGSRIGQIGGVVPGFDNLFYDKNKLKKSLGVDVIPVAMEELFDRYKLVSQKKISELVGKLKQEAVSIIVEDYWLEKTARVIGALQTIKDEYNLDAAAIRCWPEFQSELDMAPCAALAYSNDTGLPAGCEGDLVGALSMLVSHKITGTAPTINDPVAFDEDTGTIQMWHCGPGPASWADENGQTLAYHHTLNRRKSDNEKFTGVSSDISFRQGPVTVMRFVDDGSKMFVFEADVVAGPGKPFAGSGGWFGNFMSDKQTLTGKDLIETISAYGIGHHYPVSKGHIEYVYREIASWMELEVMPFKHWKPYKQW